MGIHLVALVCYIGMLLPACERRPSYCGSYNKRSGRQAAARVDLAMSRQAFQCTCCFIVTKWLLQNQVLNSPSKQKDGGEGGLGQGQLYLPFLSGNQKLFQDYPHFGRLLLHLIEQNCAIWCSPLVEEPGKVQTSSFHVL